MKKIDPKDEKLKEFGDNALFSGRPYVFANPERLTPEEAEFANYLFSDARKEAVNDPELQKEVQPEDFINFRAAKVEASKQFAELQDEKPTKKPTEKPKNSQK